MGRYSDKWFESQMKTLRPSLAWQVFILLALVLGAQPSVLPFHVELSSPHDDTLLAPKQALETLALTRLSGKKDFSKFTPVGLMQDCSVAVRLTGTIFSVSPVGSGSQPSVLSFSHNRSPPLL